MKRITGIYVFATLAFASVFVSCKKESIPPPSESGVESREALMDLNPVPLNTYPLLTKRGQESLTYFSNGKIKSRTNTSGMMVTYSYPALFPHLIIAKETFNGKAVNDIVYTLDGSGRATKMAVKYHLTEWNSYDYEYSFTYQNNRLVQQKGTKGTKEYYNFTYDAQNRLKDLSHYSENSALLFHTSFQYETAYASAKDDKYPLNPSEAWIDTYLNVFGKFSKHIPLFYITYKGPGNGLPQHHSSFMYQYDANGFVTSHKESKFINGQGTQPIINAVYEYNASRGIN